MTPVCPGKIVENSFLPGICQLKNDPIAIGTATIGGAIEIPLRVPDNRLFRLATIAAARLVAEMCIEH